MFAYAALVRGHLATGASQDTAQRLAHLILSGLREAQAFLNGGSPMFFPKEKETVAAVSQMPIQGQVSDFNNSTTVLKVQEHSPTNLQVSSPRASPAAFAAAYGD